MMNIKELEDLINNNEFKYIFLDVDGVIFHSVEAMVKLLNKRHNINVNPKNITSWNFSNCYPNMTDEEVEWLFTTNEFFDNVKMIDGVKEFILKYIDKIILVTKGNINNINQKRIYFDLNGLERVKMLGIPLNISKDIINMWGSVFIDDSTNNLNEVTTAKLKIQFNEYGSEIADKCEWSKGWDGIRMESWV